MTRSSEFLSYLKEIYQDRADEIYKFMCKPRKKSFRVNTLKTTDQEVLQRCRDLDIIFQSSPLEHAYFYEDSQSKVPLSHSELVTQGLVYIQNLSSMLPVVKLNPQADEKVIDLCAAPGGKSVIISQYTQNLGELWVVERSKPRFFLLKSQLELYGVKAKALLEDAKGLEYKKPVMINYFDAVLLDAPCSNEADINPCDEQSLDTWKPKRSKRLAGEQLQLLNSGWNMVKPGGRLVYSTCTISKEENEGVISQFLESAHMVARSIQERTAPDDRFTGFFTCLIEKKSL